jgi:hypothetical protein
MIDPDKKVEQEKRKHEADYQSTEHPEHFKDEGSEYLDLKEKEDNDTKENADFDKIYGLKTEDKKEGNSKNNKKEDTDPSNPKATAESGIPGTTEAENIGTASSGAGLGGNKGKGTSSFENQKKN